MAHTKILIMAGGTGGHVYPALALAHALLEQDIQVEWLGTSTGLESKIVPDNNILLHQFPIQGVRGKGLMRWIILPITLIKAVIAAKIIIKHVNPEIVVGFGGYVAGPGGIAAWLSGKPLIIHEQNAKAGLTNRWLRHLAKKTFAAFPYSFRHDKKIDVIGNPMRQDLMAQAQKHKINFPVRSPKNILILGGSQGAKILNEIVPRALALIPESDRPIIEHQAGEKTIAIAQQAYQNSHVNATVKMYIDDMAAALSWAHVVICRAGAMTVSEIALFAKPAIFVPIPCAVDNHQFYNCSHLVKASAAVCIQQKDFTADLLAAVLMSLLQDNKRLVMMAQQAKQLAMPEATDKLLAACLRLSKESV